MNWNETAPKGTAVWCNEWRSRYRSMPFTQHQSDTDKIMVAHDHPNSAAVDEFNLMDCLSSIDHSGKLVIEFGGWRGAKANQALTRFPGISAWLNYDICPSAMLDRRCVDGRYSIVVPDRFIWETQRPASGDIFVTSHSIEHLTTEHLTKLFAWLPDSIEWMYLCAPLPESCTDNLWHDYGGTHILELGWLQVLNLLPDFDFVCGEGEFRWLRRKSL